MFVPILEYKYPINLAQIVSPHPHLNIILKVRSLRQAFFEDALIDNELVLILRIQLSINSPTIQILIAVSASLTTLVIKICKIVITPLGGHHKTQYGYRTDVHFGRQETPLSPYLNFPASFTNLKPLQIRRSNNSNSVLIIRIP